MHHPSGGCTFVALELLLSTGAGDGNGGLMGHARHGWERNRWWGRCRRHLRKMGATGVAGSSAGAGAATGTIGAAGEMC